MRASKHPIPRGERRQPLLCTDCGRPYAYVLPAGVLLIISRHGGEDHPNVITLARLVEMIQAATAGDPPPPSGDAGWTAAPRFHPRDAEGAPEGLTTGEERAKIPVDL